MLRDVPAGWEGWESSCGCVHACVMGAAGAAHAIGNELQKNMGSHRGTDAPTLTHPRTPSHPHTHTHTNLCGWTWAAQDYKQSTAPPEELPPPPSRRAYTRSITTMGVSGDELLSLQCRPCITFLLPGLCATTASVACVCALQRSLFDGPTLLPKAWLVLCMLLPHPHSMPPIALCCFFPSLSVASCLPSAPLPHFAGSCSWRSPLAALFMFLPCFTMII